MFLSIILSTALAVEGMWPPQQIGEHASDLQSKGLEIAPDDLSDLNGPILQSIVSLGFCSAAFISEDGLIATNHHCISSYLQHIAHQDSTVINDGFLADSQTAEIPVGPQGKVYLLQEMTDVTAEMQIGITDRTSDNKRQKRIAQNRNDLIVACEHTSGVQCNIQSSYQGSQFFLYKNVELQDLRLVYAPPLTIGSFGGEVDNWQWPRHTGDFALLRAYVSAEGDPSPYQAENTPYHPKHNLTVSSSGIGPNDFVAVIGYPGKTMRHSLAIELEYAADVYYPWKNTLQRDWINILEGFLDTDQNAQVKLSTTMGGLQNSTKNTEGMINALANPRIRYEKQFREQQYREWALQIEAGDQYLLALDELIGIIELEQRSQLEHTYLTYLQQSNHHLSLAVEAYTWAVEQQKINRDRKEGYQERDRARIENHFQAAEHSHYPSADQELFRYMLSKPESISVDFLQEYINIFDDQEQMLNALFDNQMMHDPQMRLALLSQTPAELQLSPNPWIKLAIQFHQYWEEQHLEKEQFAGAKQRLQPMVLEGMKHSLGGAFYPDANGTLRITYGNVMGYSPAEAIYYSPQTTVDGMLAKVGNDPFEAPEWLIKSLPTAVHSQYRDFMLGTIPVNFLSDLDVTGGNSGSATINANGEFVGFLFDGNIESVASDWVFNPELTRSIHADVRYMLWLLELQENGTWVLDELLQ